MNNPITNTEIETVIKNLPQNNGAPRDSAGSGATEEGLIPASPRVVHSLTLVLFP